MRRIAHSGNVEEPAREVQEVLDTHSCLRRCEAGVLSHPITYDHRIDELWYVIGYKTFQRKFTLINELESCDLISKLALSTFAESVSLTNVSNQLGLATNPKHAIWTDCATFWIVDDIIASRIKVNLLIN